MTKEVCTNCRHWAMGYLVRECGLGTEDGRGPPRYPLGTFGCILFEERPNIHVSKHIITVVVDDGVEPDTVRLVRWDGREIWRFTGLRCGKD